jgi:hypothetical protein
MYIEKLKRFIIWNPWSILYIIILPMHNRKVLNGKNIRGSPESEDPINALLKVPYYRI